MLTNPAYKLCLQPNIGDKQNNQKIKMLQPRGTGSRFFPGGANRELKDEATAAFYGERVRRGVGMATQIMGYSVSYFPQPILGAWLLFSFIFNFFST